MDWTNKSDTELEKYGAEEAGIVLETDAERCKVCGTGDVTVVNRDRSEESFVERWDSERCSQGVQV